MKIAFVRYEDTGANSWYESCTSFYPSPNPKSNLLIIASWLRCREEEENAMKMPVR